MNYIGGDFIMSEMKDFVYQTARTLPVILLLDISGSMFENNKIGAMNSAVRDMLTSFKNYDCHHLYRNHYFRRFFCPCSPAHDGR